MRHTTSFGPSRRLRPFLVATCVPLILLASLLGQRVGQSRRILWAGVAKVEITDRSAGPVNDPLFVKALVLKDARTTVAVITVDAVAIGEIGYIGNDYLPKVRSHLQSEMHIEPEHVLVNASHCHGVVCRDVDRRTVEAVRLAMARMVPVRVGAGVGHEDRIQENRRLKLTNGREADVRRAYALPPDDEVAAVGPIDPEVGLLRLDRLDGRPLAVLYNFACHPIQGVPSGGNTADLVGFASKVLEDNLGPGTLALFLQGCAGDINPIHYKDPNHPPDAQRLGNLLGLTALKAARTIRTTEVDRITIVQEKVPLPLADYRQRIRELEAEQHRLANSLRGTYLDLKSFIPLYLKYSLSPKHPSAHAYRYLHERRMGRDGWDRLDKINRQRLERYIDNIRIMERLTRLNTNLALLRKNQAKITAMGKPTIDVEMVGLRIGDFVLLSFPGELTVEIGLDLKRKSPQDLTFIAGYTNGYIYYCPTAKQLRNVGGAQEDSDCLVAPAWENVFKRRALKLLQRLSDDG